MLSDDTLDKLVDIIADRQNDIANEVIEHIAERIKEIGMLKASDAYKLEMLLKTGSDINKINKALAKLTNKQVKDIKKLLEKVAQEAYVDTKPFYEYKGMSFIPYDENTQLKKVVNSIAKQTANTYINLSKSQAFMLRDSNGKLRPTKLSATYQKVVDKAVQAAQIGVKNYNGAMRNTMKELIDSGIRSVEYTSISGRRYTQRLDTAVRRNLMDGIRAINQGVQDETGKQFGADGKEITVHMNPAPDHQYVQGHQLTNEEYDRMQQGLDFKDVNGKKFDGFDRAIGTLNCRHFAFSILIGAFKPNYTKEQLDDILKKNQEGYTLPMVGI